MWGNNIKISIFGESHGAAIGVVVDGLPAGEKIDFDQINLQMQRRCPGNSAFTSTRKECDAFQIISGFLNETTTGSPICAIIFNEDANQDDYKKKFILRPGHADYTAYVKYKGFSDFRGGGHFSGRLTAPLVFAGALCRQILKKSGVFIGSHIKSIGDILDEPFDKTEDSEFLLDKLSLDDFPVLNKEVKIKMQEKILEILLDGDSIGGTIECMISGVPPGIGNPIFDSIESKISSIIFSIPGVKGIEFGRGFGSSKIKGSENSDEFEIKNGKIRTVTNNNGGILGGISSGMPIFFTVAFKPTPSIKKVQKTINLENNLEQEINIEGRHDPCIVARASAIVEASAAIAMLDFYKLT